MTPQYRIEQYLAAINAAYLGETPLPEYPAEPAWRIERFLAAILSATKGDSPVMACPDPVWHIEEFGRAIYDAMTGASPAWPCPTATNNIEAILFAIYKMVADGTETEGITTSWDIEHWLLGSYEAAKEGGGTEETVTGTAPINLAAALAKPLVSLTQYGLCTQASAPTPISSVPIKCNNGTMKMVDDELPDGYKRVIGFACNNNAMWEITDFHLKGSDTVRVSFSVEAACNVFGCYQGTEATDNYDLYASTTSGSKYLRYGNGTYLSYWSSANLGQRFNVVFTPTGTTGMPDDSTWTAKTFTSANDLLIGSTTTTGTSSKLKGNLYGSIVVDGRLNLVPCERVSDGVLGYYDTYTNTFYEPYTGFEGAVSLGYDGSHYQLSVVGTPEVLTVSGINLYDPSTRVDGYRLKNTGPIVDNKFCYSAPIPVEYGKTYTMSGVCSETGNKFLNYYSDSDEPSSANYVGSTYKNASTAGAYQKSITFNDANVKFVRISIPKTDEQVVFNEGNTAASYEPYVAPQTASVPMLLSVDDVRDEAEIISGTVTRKCGTYVFNGEETFGSSSAYGTALYINAFATTIKANKTVQPICTHFVAGEGTGTQPEGTCFFNASGHFYFRTTDSATDFKAFLKDAYDAGTPVIIVFAKSTEATEQTDPQELTPTAGTNTISVTAEVSPITLEAVYKKARS